MYSQYIEYLASFMSVIVVSSVSSTANSSSSLCSAIAYLIFGRFDLYMSLVGFAALGVESTLPIPQVIRSVQMLHLCVVSSTFVRSNYRQKSLYGFRMSTLLGWVGGDSFKSVFPYHIPMSFIRIFPIKGCVLLPPGITLAVQGMRTISIDHRLE